MTCSPHSPRQHRCNNSEIRTVVTPLGPGTQPVLWPSSTCGPSSGRYFRVAEGVVVSQAVRYGPWMPRLARRSCRVAVFALESKHQPLRLSARTLRNGTARYRFIVPSLSPPYPFLDRVQKLLSIVHLERGGAGRGGAGRRPIVRDAKQLRGSKVALGFSTFTILMLLSIL